MMKAYNLFISLCIVLILPTLNGNTLENTTNSEDDFQVSDIEEKLWQEMEARAEKTNREAYFTNPYEVSKNFTSIIAEDVEGHNNTRRSLKGKKAGLPCTATNPIDRCWRCDPNWEKDRQKLATCVLGFGKNTIGGKGGEFYTVTDPSDDDIVNPKPGTLRYAVTRDRPLWIIFSRNMNIKLTQELLVSSDKTIDGRGVDVHISKGCGITINYAQNVIIHGIKVYDIKPGVGGRIRYGEGEKTHIRTRSDGDGISIYASSNVWIDHVSMRNCTDGLIDAIRGSTAITISNCHFTDHNKVMLFGANDFSPDDKIMQITVAFNHFGKRLVQRMPRCRFGFFHLVNNDYTHWEMYAIGGSMHPIIISEGNRFMASNDSTAKEVTKRNGLVGLNLWQWKSINDEFINGAFFKESGPDLVLSHLFKPEDILKAIPGRFVSSLTEFAGALRCRYGRPC
ncbi:hypothetical protein HN51_007145 [Arachis hypogaea]|uniref:Pectate lyase n=2 Tax=Arachis TaxID=3817 RepID=A0A445D9B0_ARAHY|nr:pectate lyase-like [Arachis hypogaea]QHO41205.1 putative pectate lyase [Arachis hypogaea]RYR59754.1 hypothetical protein Ahy_A05g025720 [Arachis hypogaea]